MDQISQEILDSKTTRVLASDLRNYVNQCVRVVGQFDVEETQKIMSQGRIVLRSARPSEPPMVVRLDEESISMEFGILEVVGTVADDLSIEPQLLLSLDNFDLGVYEEVIARTRKFPAIF